MSGKSAGGNLVLDLACRADAEHLRSDWGGTVSRVAAAVAYPVVDPAYVHDDRDPVLGGVARGMATRCTGGAPARYPARYHAITSSERVDPAAPPTWLLIPIQGRLVPDGQTYTFARCATAAGIAGCVVSVPRSDHGFGLIPGSIDNRLFLAATTALLQRPVPAPIR